MSDYADPWASDSNPEAPQHEAPFDPFADDVEDVSGGGRSNAHSFVSLLKLAGNGGHVVILKPVSFQAQVPTDNGPKDTFECELHILAGPGAQVEKREKNEKTGKYENTGQYYKIGDGTEFPWPISWTNPTIRVNQSILVGQLRHVFDTATGQPMKGGLWVGRLRLVPHARLHTSLQRMTPDELDAHARAFRAGETEIDPGKPGIKLMNATPEEKQKARAYWRSIGR